MSRRNLKYQFLQAINNSFTESMDKHADKANGIRNTNKIYSYSARSNLVDLSANFSNFMKQNFSDIHMINEININHIQAFLSSKVIDCSQATLNQYNSQFKKLKNVLMHNIIVMLIFTVPLYQLALKMAVVKLEM